MKKLCVLITVLFFFINIQAQPVKTTEVKASDDSKEKKAEVAKNTDDKENDKNDKNKNNDPDKKGNNNTAGNDDPKPETEKKSKFNLPPEKANPVKIPKAQTPVVIDGNLDEEIWKQAAVFKDFYQTSPGDNIAPSKPTEAYVFYDEKHLYIGFKCWDDRDKIRATIAKRDGVFGEDNVRVWLDTYDDQRRAYILGFNPLGIQQDGIFTEGQGNDFSVDIVMESKGAIHDWGWSVEAKIPFKSLRYTAGEGKMWGFNVARNIDRLNDEFNSWMPDDRDVSGFLIKHGKITGLNEIKTERTLEIVPSVTISQTGRRVRTIPRFVLNSRVTNPNGSLIDPGRFVNEGIDQDIGVTLKYTITPNVTLDAAVNPDFAEIEADAPVVTANQRFPIFFSEKRPFFLEGVEIFQSPMQIFHSRTIVDPDVAAKLTGKIGKNSFGFLVASDNAPGNFDEDDRNDPSVRPGIDEFLDKNAMFAIVRLKRDIGKENNIGFFGTMRTFPEQRNFVGGFDGKFKWSAKSFSVFQVLGTHSRRCFFDPIFEPAIDPLQTTRNREICGGGTYSRYRTGNGAGYYVNYDYTEKNRGFFIEAGGRTKDYRADAGFTRRTNTNFVFAGGRLSTESKPKAPIIRLSWFNGVGMNYDWQGRSQDVSWNSNLNLNLQKNTFVNLSGGAGYSRIYEREFGLSRMPSRPTSGAFFDGPERSTVKGWMSAFFRTSPSKRYAIEAFVGTIINQFDFDFGAGPKFPRVSPAALAGSSKLDPGTGQQFDYGVEFELKPTDPWNIELSYNRSRLVRSDTDKVAFDANLVTLRSTYQFTRFTFARIRWDYDSIRTNFRGQMLVGWTPNPGTAFYVGYNDNFNYNGFNPYTGQFEPRFERNTRTFFIRASYLFRKSF